MQRLRDDKDADKMDMDSQSAPLRPQRESQESQGQSGITTVART